MLRFVVYLRCESRVSALDVEELLHADIGTKASFCDAETVLGRKMWRKLDLVVQYVLVSDSQLYLSNKLQGDLISNNGRISNGNVGKRTGVNHDRGSLDSLE